MVKASSASRDAKAVWPLFVTLGLLTLLAVVGSPNMGLRGFADGFVLGLSLIVVVLLSAVALTRQSGSKRGLASTPGVLEDARPSVARPSIEAPPEVDLEGLDLPLV